MSSRIFVVTGTDTGVGKTVFSAALVAALDGCYWKPVQAGLDGRTDSETVRRLSGLPADRILPEARRLKLAASPHLGAAAENISIDRVVLTIPEVKRPLVIEGAGGVMVPLSPHLLEIELFASWEEPVIVCARTALGTINHTLLTVEALRRRRVPIHGIAFIGDEEREVEATICELGHVARLGRLPRIRRLGRRALAEAFAEGFDMREFLD
ncbi:MAG: dethiobiotin synthase [Hyphomicrobiaceae bacterium]